MLSKLSEIPGFVRASMQTILDQDNIITVFDMEKKNNESFMCCIWPFFKCCVTCVLFPQLFIFFCFKRKLRLFLLHKALKCNKESKRETCRTQVLLFLLKHSVKIYKKEPCGPFLFCPGIKLEIYSGVANVGPSSCAGWHENFLYSRLPKNHLWRTPCEKVGF